MAPTHLSPSTDASGIEIFLPELCALPRLTSLSAASFPRTSRTSRPTPASSLPLQLASLRSTETDEGGGDAALAALTRLSLRENSLAVLSSLSGAFAHPFAGRGLAFALPALTELDVGWTDVTGSQLKWLSLLPDLAVLDISHTKVGVDCFGAGCHRSGPSPESKCTSPLAPFPSPPPTALVRF